MSTLDRILGQYRKLCGFCDGFWDTISRKYPSGITCCSGCSSCCELQSVNYIEAFVITEHLARSGSSVPAAAENGCPLLTDDRCRVYPVRPLICRTHGLLLRSREFRGRLAPSCPRNFTEADLAALRDTDALDIDRVTNSLARLNAAFCLTLGDLKKAKERIALRDIADGKIRRSWFGLEPDIQ